MILYNSSISTIPADGQLGVCSVSSHSTVRGWLVGGGGWGERGGGGGVWGGRVGSLRRCQHGDQRADGGDCLSITITQVLGLAVGRHSKAGLQPAVAPYWEESLPQKILGDHLDSLLWVPRLP